MCKREKHYTFGLASSTLYPFTMLFGKGIRVKDRPSYMAVAVTYSPPPRCDAFIASSQGKLYLWGGQGDFKHEEVYIYSVNTESWLREFLNGFHLPAGLNNGGCSLTRQHVYFYGGYEGPNLSGSLCQINIDNLTCSELSNCTVGGPLRKSGCRMITFMDQLLVLGGYCGHREPNSKQLGSRYENGYTNELHCYDLTKGSWSSPVVTGSSPPPVINFSLTMIDEEHAVMFGGCLYKSIFSADVYILNLLTMFWSYLQHSLGDPWPEGRSNHIAVCLGYGRQHKKLLISGGLNGPKVLSDTWLLDPSLWEWKEVLPNDAVMQRWGHGAASLTITPECEEVVIFGGQHKYFGSVIAETAVLRFEKHYFLSEESALVVEWKLTDVADNTELGTKERLHYKKKLNGEDVSDKQGFISIAETTATYSGKAKTYKWKDGGMEMDFEDEDLPPGVTESSITVSTAVSGESDFPGSSELVSGLYKFEASYKPSKPVKIKIQHCSTEANIQNLSFAKSTDTSPPYQYVYMSGGTFTHSHGELGINEYCYYAILDKYEENDLHSLSRKSYLISLHCSMEPVVESPSHLSWSLYFSMVKNCILFENSLKTFFHRFHEGPVEQLSAIVVKFNESSQGIKIGIDNDELKSQVGWSMLPVVHSSMKKCEVDNYVDGRPPQFRLLLIQNLGISSQDLNYKFMLDGVEDNEAHITMYKSASIHKSNYLGPSHTTLYKRYVNKIDETKSIFHEEISDAHLRQIAEKLVHWEEKCDLLGLEWIPDVHDIQKKYINEPKLQRIEALHLWKQRDMNPTYENLLKICSFAGFRKSAETIVAILNEN